MVTYHLEGPRAVGRGWGACHGTSRGGELGSGGASTGPAGAVPTISYLFHPLDFFGSASDGPAAPMTATFRHPCVDDIYDGKMVLRGADEFTWSWRISGPDKDGEICTRYTRDRDASAPL